MVRRIRGRGVGWVFTEGDVAGALERKVVDTILHRLAKKGMIRRVLRGVYEYPKYSKVLGGYVPTSLDGVAQAVARKFGWRIQPDGVTAQGLLGLTTQVPAKVVYLSDGPTRRYKVGKRTLEFRRIALKEAVFKMPESRMVVQALRAFGQDRVTPDVVDHIRKRIDGKVRKRMLVDARTATGWVYEILRELADG
jgi:hypothetical protein